MRQAEKNRITLLLINNPARATHIAQAKRNQEPAKAPALLEQDEGQPRGGVKKPPHPQKLTANNHYVKNNDNNPDGEPDQGREQKED